MNITTRTQWGAAPARSRTPASWPPGSPLHVHHTVGAFLDGASPATEQAEMRAIQRYHQQSNGWSDIGYHYVVFPSGRVYEGRGRGVVGAHSPTVNHQASVALAGDYSRQTPSPAQHLAVWELRDHLGLGPLRGHRDTFATACPGDAAYRLIVQGPRPDDVAERPTPPAGATLRLALHDGARAKRWAGWEEAGGALAWIKSNGLRPRTKVALAWRGSLWRYNPATYPNRVEITRPDGATRHVVGDARYVARVATTIYRRHLA